jgi:hypothetical protein
MGLQISTRADLIVCQLDWRLAAGVDIPGKYLSHDWGFSVEKFGIRALLFSSYQPLPIVLP